MAPQPPTGAAAAEVTLPPPARVRYLLAELAACEAAIHAARDEGGGARTSRLRAQALNSSAEVDAVKLGSALSRAQVRHGFLLLSSFYTPTRGREFYTPSRPFLTRPPPILIRFCIPLHAPFPISAAAKPAPTTSRPVPLSWLGPSFIPSSRPFPSHPLLADRPRSRIINTGICLPF